VVIILVISLVSGLAIFVVYKISNAPRKMNEFMEISLTDTKEDILFLKGEPSKIDEHGYWDYDESKFYIAFKENKVRYILTFSRYASIQGISILSKSKKVIKKFGQPSSEDISSKKTIHCYLYEKYNVFFWLEQDRVSGLGIYNPELGTFKFSDL